MILDGDDAGRRGVSRAAGMRSSSAGMPTRVVVLPQGEDPATTTCSRSARMPSAPRSRPPCR